MPRVKVIRENCKYPECGAPCREFCKTRGNAMSATYKFIGGHPTPPPADMTIEEKRAYYNSFPRDTKMNVTPVFCGGCGLCIAYCQNNALVWSR